MAFRQYRLGFRCWVLPIALALRVGACSQNTPPPSIEERLIERLITLQEEYPNVPGFALTLQLDDGRMISAATGMADPEGTPMTSRTPVRIASITKTFVAATVLTLMEGGLIELDAPIAPLIAPEFDSMLRDDGYDTDAITVRHLLMHVSGMPDHAGDRYLAMVLEDPDRAWTPGDQIGVLVSFDDPLGPPAEQFKYSDTGYILLGDIVERATGKSLPKVVRERMKFSEIGLESVWWDEREQTPVDGPGRAHQYIDGMPTFALNGTMDAFGGGGLVASTEHLVAFYSALFGGEIFSSPQTLTLMTEAPGHPYPDSYRMGLFPMQIEGSPAFGHGGFWGTYAIHIPADDITVAGVALDQAGYRAMTDAMRAIVAEAATQD